MSLDFTAFKVQNNPPSLYTVKMTNKARPLVTKQKCLVKIIFTAGAIAVSLSVAKAMEVNPDGWPVPDVKSATLARTAQKDLIESVPGNETTIQVYRTATGTVFNVLSYNDRVYGYFVDTDGEPPIEYALMDPDGSGKYTNKCSGEEVCAIGEWVYKEKKEDK